jgi:transposase
MKQINEELDARRKQEKRQAEKIKNPQERKQKLEEFKHSKYALLTKKENLIVEGINQKIKLIKRRAYGFINFDNFRRRVLLNWYSS